MLLKISAEKRSRRKGGRVQKSFGWSRRRGSSQPNMLSQPVGDFGFFRLYLHIVAENPNPAGFGVFVRFRVPFGSSWLESPPPPDPGRKYPDLRNFMVNEQQALLLIYHLSLNIQL